MSRISGIVGNPGDTCAAILPCRLVNAGSMSVQIDGVQFRRPADDNVKLTLANLKLPRQSLLAAKELRLRSEELRTEQDKVLNLHEEVMERVLC